VNSKIITYVLIVFICFIPEINLIAQFQTTLYTDIGQNVVSDGLFIKMADLANYQFGKNKVEAGLQVDIISNTDRFFSGYNIKASREFMIKSFPLDAQGFFILTPFSDILRETNWGILFGMYRNHFSIRIGTHFRTYAYNQKTIKSYGFETDARLHENWNLIYSFDGYVKPINNLWNIGLSVTNIDHFIINQETNPILNVKAGYRIQSTLNLFLESWYKSAGAFNLNVNYFGFFFRTGIIWDIHSRD